MHNLRQIARARFGSRGQPSAFAHAHDICDETILGFLRGIRPPADELLRAMGWERQIFYRRVEPCPCFACTKHRVENFGDGHLGVMFLCETCGNKRCPHAADHRNACTDSNEPGQPGSLYPASLYQDNREERGECSTGVCAAGGPSSAATAAKVPTSREIMLAGGVDPDAPFEIGPFPSEMRQAPSPDRSPKGRDPKGLGSRELDQLQNPGNQP